MNKPIDYPLEPNSVDANTDNVSSDITYAILRDRVDAKKPITDEMIRTARTKMDTAQGESTYRATMQDKPKSRKIRDRFRAK